MNDENKYYDLIKSRIIDDEIYRKVKDYSKEQHRIKTYYEIGKLLSEAGKHYGDGIIKEYSCKLKNECGKKYTVSLLYKMKQFYNIYKKIPTMSGKLTWSHWYEMLSFKDIEKIKYYIYQCEHNNLDVRSLRDRIKSKEYERLCGQSSGNFIIDKIVDIKALVPNPILIRNTNNIDVVNEKVLHKLIIENISSFMKQLGNGYSYIDSEYRIMLGKSYNYIDILLFNIKFNCYVVVELKVTELKKEYIGQIEVYMNYVDTHLKDIMHDKTIGIIICKKDNKYIIEYASDKRIISREYMVV